jgi:anti-anti-sigma factor
MSRAVELRNGQKAPPFPPEYRASGLLLDVTPLPSPYGIGDLGREALAWVGRLHDAGQRWWQALPLGAGGSGMKSALFGGWGKKAGVEETRLEAGEIAVHVVPGSNQLTVAVAGRTTVDSSPHLRSVLLGLLRRATAPVVVIDLSALSYLDMSGIATLLETLKAARERSVKLRLAGMSGQARTLAEIAQLDTIYRAWGSEVEFR